MARDDEVEAIAMQVILAYERAQGRDPEDVSAESLGFDIRSKGPDGPRYIEVKGRAAVGSVALTRNEWIKAHAIWGGLLALHRGGLQDGAATLCVAGPGCQA